MPGSMSNPRAILSSYRVGGVEVVVVDNPPRNVLSRELRIALLEQLQKSSNAPDVEAIAILGANGHFLTEDPLGALDTCPDVPTIADLSDAIEASAKPVIAAITGPAEDGGLSIALACDWRIATASASAGFPRTMLGLVPEGGATQRLPRIVGARHALRMTATMNVKAPEGAAFALFNEVVDGDAAAHLAQKAKIWSKRRSSDRTAPVDDETAIDKEATSALRRGKGSQSVKETVELIRLAATTPWIEGIKKEREACDRAQASSEARALQHLAWAETQSDIVPGAAGASVRPIERATVIGAGTMGSGIAVTLASAGIVVDLLEQNAEAALAGGQRVRDLFQAQVKAGRLTEDDAKERQQKVSATDNWDVVVKADLVIEAAFEDMDVKKPIFTKLDRLAKPGAVLATNTSYLDVDAIADITDRPADVLGLHFFSPAHIMRLLEVVQASRTSADVVATGMALGRRIGKLPIAAGVCDGFIGNRIFAVYRRHAEYLLEDGASARQIDEALQAYGFAMGPFAVSDMSGLDIAWAMRKRRAATRDPLERYVAIPDRLCEAGRLGRKAGKGWYDYLDGRTVASAEVEEIIASERRRQAREPQAFTPEQIQRRILAVMVNEGARVLEEGISLRPSDIDLVFVNGYGFPRLRGGPLFAADEQGLAETLADVEEAARVGGAGSEPSALLVDLARDGRTFTEWQRTHRETAGRGAS